MIKQVQIKELNDGYQFHYITAITKPQIEKLINEGTIQLSFLDENITEVEMEGVRYVMHRNPVRAEEIENVRQSKRASVQKCVDKKNQYLAKHPQGHLTKNIVDKLATA